MKTQKTEQARWLLTLVALGACLPADAESLEEDARELHVRLEPDGSPAVAPPVLRVRARVGAEPDPEDLHLVEGEVKSGHLAQIARDDISVTLSERLVPVMRWVEGEEIVLAPTRVLAPGSYAVVLGSARMQVPIVVAADDPLPMLRSVWAGRGLAVWCGEQLLPRLAMPAQLQPAGVDVEVRTGAHGVGIGGACVHVETPALDGAVVPPPALLGADGWPFARIEPVELAPEPEAEEPVPMLCPLGQLPVGPACVSMVADDRLRIDAPDGELLWLLGDGRQLDFVGRTDGGSLLVYPLTPATPTDISWAAISRGGRTHGGVARVFTQPPMAHVVITEVLANPIGPEPEQELIELYNDGLAPADLSHFAIEDVGGRTDLPPGLALLPGKYAIVVDAGFDVSSEYDPAPAKGTLIVRVAELGKNGLKNDGEPLKLVKGNTVVSRFPSLPKPKAGESVQRISPQVAADDTEGFVRAEPTPGSGYLAE